MVLFDNSIPKPISKKRRRRRNRFDLPDDGGRFTLPKVEVEVEVKVGRRNWLDLPDDITLRIFMKLETTHLLVTARYVCCHWRKLAKTPILYRSVVLGPARRFFNQEVNYGTLAKQAVALSCGQMLQFSCSLTDDLTEETLHHIVASSFSGLKSLRLGFASDMDAYAIIQLVKSLPSLEEFYYWQEVILKHWIEEIGHSCPRLQYFSCRTIYSNYDVEAFAIAKNMPHLRRLCLFGNDLTNNGLLAILDGCPHLEYFYLLGCFHVNLDQDADDFWNKVRVSGRLITKRLLKLTDKKECELELKPLHPLPHLCPAKEEEEEEEVADSALYQYTSPFVDLWKAHHYPHSPDGYDWFVRVHGY